MNALLVLKKLQDKIIYFYLLITNVLALKVMLIRVFKFAANIIVSNAQILITVFHVLIFSQLKEKKFTIIMYLLMGQQVNKL